MVQSRHMTEAASHEFLRDLCGRPIPIAKDAPAYGQCGRCDAVGYVCPLCGDHCAAGYGLVWGGYAIWFTCTACLYFHAKREVPKQP